MARRHSAKLSERAKQLFTVLVDLYIREGQPIGSRTLSKDLDIDLSPATIRNVMSDLEEMGLIFSPHTSAGRIPTQLGYRLFVDTLLQVNPLKQEEEAKVRQQFFTELPRKTLNAQQLVEQASKILSEITHFAGIVMLPRRQTVTLRHLEFLRLSEKRILIILVINDHEVQNRIIHTTREYSAAELERVANYLNSAFIGKDFSLVRQELLLELQQTRQHIDDTLHAIIDIAGQVFTEVETVSHTDFVMAGQTNLMDINELANLDKLRELFVAFNEKREILRLLDQAMGAQGMQIFIGDESGYKVLGDCSVVTSPYKVQGEVIGVLGVIGPTRMPYGKVIPIVDLTAKLLSSALNPHESSLNNSPS